MSVNFLSILFLFISFELESAENCIKFFNNFCVSLDVNCELGINCIPSFCNLLISNFSN